MTLHISFAGIDLPIVYHPLLATTAANPQPATAHIPMFSTRPRAPFGVFACVGSGALTVDEIAPGVAVGAIPAPVLEEPVVGCASA
jgi:hypothetical protein